MGKEDSQSPQPSDYESISRYISEASADANSGDMLSAISKYQEAQSILDSDLETISPDQVLELSESLNSSRNLLLSQLQDLEETGGLEDLFSKIKEILDPAEMALNNGDVEEAERLVKTCLNATEFLGNIGKKIKLNESDLERFKFLLKRIEDEKEKNSRDKTSDSENLLEQDLQLLQLGLQRELITLESQEDLSLETIAVFQSERWLGHYFSNINTIADENSELSIVAEKSLTETNKKISEIAEKLIEERLLVIETEVNMGVKDLDKLQEEFKAFAQDVLSHITLLRYSRSRGELNNRIVNINNEIKSLLSNKTQVVSEKEPETEYDSKKTEVIPSTDKISEKSELEKIKTDPPKEIAEFYAISKSVDSAKLDAFLESEIHDLIFNLEKSFNMVSQLYLDETYGEFRNEKEYGKIKFYLETMYREKMESLLEVWKRKVRDTISPEISTILSLGDASSLSRDEINELKNKIAIICNDIDAFKVSDPKRVDSELQFLNNLNSSLIKIKEKLDSELQRRNISEKELADYTNWKSKFDLLLPFISSMPSLDEVSNLSPLKRKKTLKSVQDFFETNQVLFEETDNQLIKADMLPVKKRLQEFILNVREISKDDVTSVTLESYRQKPLDDLLLDWFTLSIQHGGEAQLSFFRVLDEHLDDMQSEFIEHGHHLHKTESESLTLWKQFKDLCNQAAILTDFGVMRADALNTNDLTAIHDKVLAAASKDGAMKNNTKLNNLEIVRAINVNPGTQYCDNAGLVQKIAFAAFQEMCKPLPSSGIDPSKTSPFSRNNGFTEITAQQLVESVAKINVVSLAEGMPNADSDVVVDIQKELEQFPEEARKIILMIAKWKITRDDLGTKAGIWHLGRNKGAFKFANGGPGKPTGVMSSVLYNVGKNTARDYHAAMLYFIDPKNTNLFLTSRKDSYKDYPDNTDVERMDREVARVMEMLEQFRLWSNPQWEKVGFEKYTPDYWYEDFPALDDFFNQSKDARTAPQYIQSRDAVLEILQMAAGSPQELFQTITDQMREKMIVMVQRFGSNIGKALAYIPPYSEDEAKCPRRYQQLHKLILAAYQFYLSSLLMAIPGRVPLASKIIGTYAKREYDELYQVGLQTMISVIDQNSTLKGFYQENTTGKRVSGPKIRNAFLNNPNIKRKWRDEHKLRNVYQSWLLRNASEFEHSSLLNKAKFANTPPHDPVNVSEGWKTSYEDPEVKRG